MSVRLEIENDILAEIGSVTQARMWLQKKRRGMRAAE